MQFKSFKFVLEGLFYHYFEGAWVSGCEFDKIIRHVVRGVDICKVEVACVELLVKTETIQINGIVYTLALLGKNRYLLRSFQIISVCLERLLQIFT